jgi:hypothetical protein
MAAYQSRWRLVKDVRGTGIFFFLGTLDEILVNLQDA